MGRALGLVAAAARIADGVTEAAGFDCSASMVSTIIFFAAGVCCSATVVVLVDGCSISIWLRLTPRVGRALLPSGTRALDLRTSARRGVAAGVVLSAAGCEEAEGVCGIVGSIAMRVASDVERNGIIVGSGRELMSEETEESDTEGTAIFVWLRLSPRFTDPSKVDCRVRLRSDHPSGKTKAAHLEATQSPGLASTFFLPLTKTFFKLALEIILVGGVSGLRSGA